MYNAEVKALIEVEWVSVDPLVARVDDLNSLHSLAKGKTSISAVYKGSISKNMPVNVVEDISTQTVQTIKQELVK